MSVGRKLMPLHVWLEHCAPNLTVFRFFANLGAFAGQIVPEEGERKQEFAGDGCSEFDPCQNTLNSHQTLKADLQTETTLK